MGVNKEVLPRLSTLSSIVDWYGDTIEEGPTRCIKKLDDYIVEWGYGDASCTLTYAVAGRDWVARRVGFDISFDHITEDEFLMVVIEPWEAVATVVAGGEDEAQIIEGFTHGLPLLLNIGGVRPAIRLYGDEESVVVVYLGYAATKVFVMKSKEAAERIVKRHIGTILEAAFDKIENLTL